MLKRSTQTGWHESVSGSLTGPDLQDAITGRGPIWDFGTTLTMWIKSDAGCIVSSSAGTSVITSMNGQGQSGASRNNWVNGTVGQQPTSSLLNGYAGVKFDGLNDRLNGAAGQGWGKYVQSGSCHFFCVASINKINGTAGEATAYLNESFVGNQTNGDGFRLGNVSNVPSFITTIFSGTQAWASISPLPTVSGTYLYEGWIRNDTNPANPSEISLWTRVADRAPRMRFLPHSGVTNGGMPDLATVPVISPNFGGTNFISGTIGEMMIFSRSLVPAESSIVRRYLGKKWNVTY